MQQITVENGLPQLASSNVQMWFHELKIAKGLLERNRLYLSVLQNVVVDSILSRRVLVDQTQLVRVVVSAR